MIITNSRYALVGYFITSYPTRAHGIIVIYSLKLSMFDLQPATCILQPATCNLQPATCNLQPAPATCNLQPATCNLQPATCKLHPPLEPRFCNTLVKTAFKVFFNLSPIFRINYGSLCETQTCGRLASESSCTLAFHRENTTTTTQ